MKISRTLIGATLLACIVTACEKTAEDTAGLAENREAPPDKEIAADATVPIEAMQKPETPAERRESRLRLAGQQAKISGDLRAVASDDVKLNDSEMPAELLNKIIDDLAEKIAANGADIKVLRAESVVWNDGSLGCGQPGEMYTQALVHGYRVILEHDGQPFDYRATEKGYFMLCEKPMLAVPGAGNQPPVQ